MVTLSSASGTACRVAAGKLTIDVFPAKAGSNLCLLPHPEQDGKEKAISWPGEYDFEGMTLKGVGQQMGKQVSYTCYFEGVRCAFVAAPVQTWSDADLQALGDVDVLVIAADDPKKVQALVEEVDPRVVMLFKTKDGDLPGVAKALGVKELQPVDEFKAKGGSMPSESRQVVVLK